MPAPQPSLSARARWIICTQLAALSPARKHPWHPHPDHRVPPLHQPRPRRGRRRLPGGPARQPPPLGPRPPPARPGRPGPGHGRTRAAAAGDQPGASTSASRADHRRDQQQARPASQPPGGPDPGSGSRGGGTLRLPHRHQSSPARRVPRRRPDRRPRASPARCRGKPGPRRDHRPAGRVRPGTLRVTSDPAMGPSQLQGGTFQPGRLRRKLNSNARAVRAMRAAHRRSPRRSGRPERSW
jgi:hypothetical protein